MLGFYTFCEFEHKNCKTEVIDYIKLDQQSDYSKANFSHHFLSPDANNGSWTWTLNHGWWGECSTTELLLTWIFHHDLFKCYIFTLFVGLNEKLLHPGDWLY